MSEISDKEVWIRVVEVCLKSDKLWDVAVEQADYHLDHFRRRFRDAPPLPSDPCYAPQNSGLD